MRRIAGHVLATAVAAVTVVGLAATPAFADSVTVDPDGPVTGALAAGELVEVATTRGHELSCDTASAAGSIADDTTGDEAVAGQLNSFSLSDNTTTTGGCLISPTNAEAEITGSNFPWNFEVTGQSSDIVQGKITGVAARVEDTWGCNFNVGGQGGASTGEVSGSYDNSTGQLTLGSGNFSLEIVSRDGSCDNQIVQVGDDVSLSGNFDIRASGGIIPTITWSATP